jgi:hypothetical protein
MTGRLPDTLAPFAVAMAAGGVALIAPPAALLVVAMLGAHALMRRETSRVDLVSLAGPAFAALIVGAFVGLAGAIGVLFVWRLVADARWRPPGSRSRTHGRRRSTALRSSPTPPRT